MALNNFLPKIGKKAGCGISIFGKSDIEKRKNPLCRCRQRGLRPWADAEETRGKGQTEIGRGLCGKRLRPPDDEIPRGEAPPYLTTTFRPLMI